MAKYNTELYDTFYYDEADSTSPSDGEIAWILNIDWDGTGFVDEADHLIWLYGFSGAENYVQHSGSGFEKFSPGKYTLTMNNSDLRYDPSNADSPLYPYILPGRPAQISVYIRDTAETIEIFTGTITDIQPVSGKEEVTIIIEDGMRDLDMDVSIGIVSMDTIDECIGTTLDAAGWNGARNLQTTNQPVQIFSAESQSALELVNNLSLACLGTFFMDRKGTATFYPISYRSDTVTTLTQDLLHREIRQPQPWENVRNSITVIANQKAKRPGSVIWSLGRALEIGSSDTITFGQGFDLSTGISQPRPYTDYLANTASNGSGLDITDQVTVLFSEVYDNETLLTVTNNYSATAYLLKLNLMGHKIVTCPEPYRSEDATSIAFYRKRRTFKLDNPWLQDRSFAETYAGWIKDFLKDSKFYPTVQIRQRPSLQYKLYLMDRVTLTVTSRGIDDTLTIRGIRHEWQNDTGQDVITTVYLADTMYNDTEITPAPYIPGEEPVSEVPFTDIPPYIDPYDPLDGFPITITPPDMTDSCLLTDALTNGPFPMTYTLAGLSNRDDDASKMESFMWYSCTLRKGNSVNPSYIRIRGTWWYEDPTLHYDDSNAWWHVDAIAADKSVLCSGVIETIDSFTRKITFRPDNAIEIAGFRVWLEVKANSFSAGDIIEQGSIIDVTDSAGTEVDGLTIGNAYSIEGDGGPWYAVASAGAGYWDLWSIHVLVDMLWDIVGGMDSQNGFQYGVTSATLPIIEKLDEHYNRGYFLAADTSIYVRVGSYTLFDDNGGSMGFILRSAIGGYPRTMSFIQSEAYNVCGTGIL